MKKALILAVAAMALLSSSCRKEDPRPFTYYEATVTFKPSSDGSYFLEQDDKTALIVTNDSWKTYPFPDGKEKRAYIRYGMYGDIIPGHKVPGYDETWEVMLIAADTIRTKSPVVYRADEEDIYGNDPVGLYLGNDVFPTTLIEDGYLNVAFEIMVGGVGVTHEINLLTNVDPNDPYTVELRHNAHDSYEMEPAKCLMDFPLKDLPDTEGKTVTLTLKWLSLVTGKYEKTTFDYCSRTDW